MTWVHVATFYAVLIVVVAGTGRSYSRWFRHGGKR